MGSMKVGRVKRIWVGGKIESFDCLAVMLVPHLTG